MAYYEMVYSYNSLSMSSLVDYPAIPSRYPNVADIQISSIPSYKYQGPKGSRCPVPSLRASSTLYQSCYSQLVSLPRRFLLPLPVISMRPTGSQSCSCENTGVIFSFLFFLTITSYWSRFFLLVFSFHSGSPSLSSQSHLIGPHLALFQLAMSALGVFVLGIGFRSL